MGKSNLQLITIILESVRAGMGGGYQRVNDLRDRATHVLKRMSVSSTTEQINDEVLSVIQHLEKKKFWVKAKKGWCGRADSVFDYEEPVLEKKE